MHDLVAHANDIRPRDLGVAVREFPRHLSRGFTNDLNEMNQREAKILRPRRMRRARRLVSC